MEKFSVSKMVLVVLAFGVVAAIASPAQTFTTLVSFDETNGSTPNRTLVQGLDGNIYGTTSGGGTINSGTVFKVTPVGKLTTLFNFVSGATGYEPFAGVVLGTDGNFYGTTEEGGSAGYGTVFSMTPAGDLTTIYSFCLEGGACPDGYFSYAALVQGTDGTFYGTTDYDGANASGTIFRITPAGELTLLYSFCHKAGCKDGDFPYAGLVEGTDGLFYGTTAYGGAHGGGTVFKITSAGVLTTLHGFCSKPKCADGNVPPQGVIQGSDGAFYGTTLQGGANNHGTVFKITSVGNLTTLYSFCSETGCLDGSAPNVGLVQGTDGNLYGTTTTGGANNYGTVFTITTTGSFSTLHSFDATDGELAAGMMQSTNGNFYGITQNGGGGNCDEGCGTVFSLSMGLSPFVETLSTSGNVGAVVSILGTDLKAVHSVSFSGTAATFTLVSPSEITTTVPLGATTGTVTVTTSSGTFNSKAPFRVTPQIVSFTPTKGPAGTAVQITGVSLTQTSGVTFGGVAATDVAVNSDTQVTATVPTGAKTGKIKITAPGGTATSSKSFTVTE